MVRWDGQNCSSRITKVLLLFLINRLDKENNKTFSVEVAN